MPNTNEDLNTRVETLEDALRGDLRGDRPGLIQHMMRVMDTLYKEPHGLSFRVEGLEKKSMIYEARAQGAIWLANILKVVIGGVIGILIHKYILK
jgi:hypothetical protein